MSSFAIKTDQFEGPLELLLHLIEERKLLINDISLASVTDKYMDYVARLPDHPVRETAQFVLVASTLLLIKSKSLLPVLELTPEESESIDELERRLRLHQIFRGAGRKLQFSFGKQISFSRTYVPNQEPLFTTDRYTTLPALGKAIQEVLQNLPKKVFKAAISVAKTVSLEDMIERLRKRITERLKVGFRDFAGDSKERVDVIVSFLAVLELVKQGIVGVRQEERYADFEIEREGVDTPTYS